MTKDPYSHPRKKLRSKKSKYVLDTNHQKKASDEEYSQAERIFHKFGGPSALARALSQADPSGRKWHRATVTKWAYPKDRGGSGGFIPAKEIDLVRRAARFQGILLTAEDLYPGPRPIKFKGVDVDAPTS